MTDARWIDGPPSTGFNLVSGDLHATTSRQKQRVAVRSIIRFQYEIRNSHDLVLLRLRQEDWRWSESGGCDPGSDQPVNTGIVEKKTPDLDRIGVGDGRGAMELRSGLPVDLDRRRSGQRGECRSRGQG